MKLEEFRVGEYFWTATGKWRVYDVGQRSVIAMNWEKQQKTMIECKGDVETPHEVTIDPQEMIKDPGGIGLLEDLIPHQIFYRYDLDGCWASQREYDFHTFKGE